MFLFSSLSLDGLTPLVELTAISFPAAAMDQDKRITIYDAANVCVRAFEDLLSLQEKDNDSFRMVDELRGRFNLWAAYVGAFAAPKASLDARLNLYPDVKHMVLELLDMVSRNIGTMG